MHRVPPVDADSSVIVSKSIRKKTNSLNVLRDQTSELVRVGVGLSVEETVREVSRGDTGERVDSSSVSTDRASRREGGTLSTIESVTVRKRDEESRLTC